MSLITYDPFRALARLTDEFPSSVFGGTGFRGTGLCDTNKCRSDAWLPAVDVLEQEGSFLISVDVPGVNTQEIDVTVEDGTLRIAGERSAEERKEEEGFVRIERSHGSFERRFQLPETVDPEKISATGENGVLKITVPKREVVTPQPKRITVN